MPYIGEVQKKILKIYSMSKFPMSNQDVAERMNIHRQQVNVATKVLEKKGLIKKGEYMPGRMREITVTKRGREILST